MPRFIFLTLFLLATLISAGTERVFALTELEVHNNMLGVEADLNVVKGDLSTFTCGGLMDAGDERALAYYARERGMTCKMKGSCAQVDTTTGMCNGDYCEVVYTPGLAVRSRIRECGGAGVLLENADTCLLKTPRTACTAAKSQGRIWECTWEMNGTAGLTAEALCYSYQPSFRYAGTYFPFAYNCSITYSASPIDPGEPRGQAALMTPFEATPAFRNGVGKWEPTAGANLAVASRGGDSYPKDSTSDALELDIAALSAVQRVMHPTIDPITSLNDYPDLLQSLGSMLQPPEIRLILPESGLSLSHEYSSLFRRIQSSSHDSTPVEEIIGNSPDMLQTVAEYLERIPLLEVEYEPVTVFVPSLSLSHIEEVIIEWETWKADAIKATGALTPAVDARVTAIITALNAYKTHHNKVRRFRLQFPAYLNALLGAVEEANAFFQEHWIKENANRLKEWHAAYDTYLPDLQIAVRELYAIAAQYTQNCQVPSCRRNAVPVNASVKPWDFIPGSGSELILPKMERAFLPENFPLWEHKRPDGQRELIGQVMRWHPLALLGLPLPDITIDLSEIYIREPIKVPVLKIETIALTLPHPPLLVGDPTLSSVALVKGIPTLPIVTLPPLRPDGTVLDLSFPQQLVVPDISVAALGVPSAPIPIIKNITSALNWRTRRLNALTSASLCPSGASDTFLVHEFDLYDPGKDPAAVRGMALVPYSSATHFPSPSISWPRTFGVPGSLVAPPICPQCSSVRPQRFIRQHLELDVSWDLLQDRLLTVIDEWNAQVKFVTILSRDDLVREDADHIPHSSLRNTLFR